MSEATEQAHVNGTAPAQPAPEPEEDRVTSGEKLLAGLAILFGLFIIVMGIDMATGGKVGGMVKERTG